MKKHIEMPSAVYYAMNRLCEWTINGNSDGVYRSRDQAAGDAGLIEEWLHNSAVCVLPTLAQPLFDPEMDEVPFAPR